jgi:hypothetical protein
MGILIRANPEKVDHKLKKNLLKEYGGKLPDDMYCYWTGVNPKNVEVEKDKVMFTDGKMVYAEGKILYVDNFEGLCFEPLKKVSYKQPKKAPTRGFTYVED